MNPPLAAVASSRIRPPPPPQGYCTKKPTFLYVRTIWRGKGDPAVYGQSVKSIYFYAFPNAKKCHVIV